MNEPIEIRRVSNGFYVLPATPDRMINDGGSVSVFESMSKLLSYIESHFEWPEKKAGQGSKC